MLLYAISRLGILNCLTPVPFCTTCISMPRKTLCCRNESKNLPSSSKDTKGPYRGTVVDLSNVPILLRQMLVSNKKKAKDGGNFWMTLRFSC